MGFWRRGRDHDEPKPFAQPNSEPAAKSGLNAGHIEVFAGITVATTMLQALILREYIDHVRSDLEKPENRTGRYSNAAEQTRLLDCAVASAWAENAADLNWIFELEGMDLIAYKLALHDLLPTILAHTDRQRVAIEFFKVKQLAEQATGFQGAVFTAAFDLSAKAFNTLEQRQRQW
jgi:hypothetical protein